MVKGNKQREAAEKKMVVVAKQRSEVKDCLRVTSALGRS